MLRDPFHMCVRARLTRVWLLESFSGCVRVFSHPGTPRAGKAGGYSVCYHRLACCYDRLNDPSAGSPTETLLRLLLPLGERVQRTSRPGVLSNTWPVRTLHQHTQSEGATGGVYKGQGRNQRELMTRAY